MYVCVCNAVTDGQINQAIEQGADSFKALRHTLGVATECGRCAECVKECLKKAHTDNAQHHHDLVHIAPVNFVAGLKAAA